jgi:hypothetical protein
MSAPDYDTVRASFLASYNAELETGSIIPFTLPFGFLNFNILIVYLIFSNYALVRRLKYVVVALTYGFSLHSVLYCRTLGLVYGLNIALIAGWCSTIASTFILFREPHVEFRRLVRRKSPAASGVKAGNGKVSATGHSTSIAKDLFYWQPMPVDITQRIFWVYDLVMSFRGPHWSWAARGTTTKPTTGSPAELPPLTQCPSLRTSIIRGAATYLALDILKSVMITDPYFLAQGTGLQSGSTSLLTWLLVRTSRNIISLAGIIAALHFNNEIAGLVSYHILPQGYALGDHSIPELYSPVFGAYSGVTEQGLAGFWASCWHQMFRFAFISSAGWVARHLGCRGRSTQARAIVMVVAFVLSGSGHAAAAFMLWGNRGREWTEAFKAFAFFALQPVGIALQMILSPTSVKSNARNTKSQSANSTKVAMVLFTLGWLWLTGPLLIDPLARGGLWLFEPIPISLVRGMGLSRDKRWWCWVGRWGRWVWHEEHWWLSGYQIL